MTASRRGGSGAGEAGAGRLGAALLAWTLAALPWSGPAGVVGAALTAPRLLAAADGGDDRLAATNETLRAEIEGYRQAIPPERAADILSRVGDLLASASEHTEAGRLDEANRLLQEARMLVIQGLTQTRSQETVVYSREFRTPADEYRFEAERFDTYARLMEKVVAQRQPGGSMGEGIRRAREEAVRLKVRATTLAEQGDWKQAIGVMDEANSKLARWLSMMGLPVAR